MVNTRTLLIREMIQEGREHLINENLGIISKDKEIKRKFLLDFIKEKDEIVLDKRKKAQS